MGVHVGLFVSAAFKLSNGEILKTGSFHDIDMVPQDLEITEEGFIGHDGQFYSREQASKILNKKNVQSEEIVGKTND